MVISAPRGTKDILNKEIKIWQKVEQIARKSCLLFSYNEVRTPIFEQSTLFTKGIGDSSDIVQKEMYIFEDRKKRRLALRPELTAGTVRAYLENKLYSLRQPVKLFYIGPVFRYERPQTGRQRQFHQFGVEAFGSPSPLLDAEVISLSIFFLKKIKIGDLKVEINSIGCLKCRPIFKKKLKEYFKNYLQNLCSDCQNRFEKNPLRILDCKNPVCEKTLYNSPSYIRTLCFECREHFDQLQAILREADISFSINPFLVRGLDYYTKTVFEIKNDFLGSQNSLCGGGRYDDLVSEFDKSKNVPAIGVAFGMERIILLLQKINEIQEKNDNIKCYIAPLINKANLIAFKLLTILRKNNIKCEIDFFKKGIKAILKQADKNKAKYIAIIGEEELEKNFISLKNMLNNTQKKDSYTNIVKIILEDK